MSELRNLAAGLVSKVSAQTLAHTKGLTQSPDELRAAWVAIRRASDQLMDLFERYEPLLVELDGYAALKDGWPGDEDASAAAQRLLQALDRFATPAPKPAPTRAEGWSRAGDVQLPLGDREPPDKGNPPP